jgi:SAM-dependent methyltransferase
MSSSLQGKVGIFAATAISPLSSRLAMTMLISLVFLGAFLLFSMEPLVGRLLVPFFGGAVHVWLICLMFFQAMLLVGYLYAHLLARKLGPWHLLLLLLPLINLPLGVVAEPSPQAPVVTLLGVLAARFALPFAVLATTAVVAQLWLATSTLRGDNNPYPLYAASNAGSLLALLGYPFLVEPVSGIKVQSLLWTAAYVLYCLLALLAWFTVQPGQRSLVPPGEEGREILSQARPTVSHYARWLLLSAFPSAFLLSITNFIALEVGSFPMIWVLPLALYLGSFIITFRTRGGIPGPLGKFWPHLLVVSLLVYLSPLILPGWGWVIVVPVIFFVICLVAHGALYESRPPVRFLTAFYLTIAAGGFIGGFAISIIAPVVLSGLYDYPIILGGLAVVFWWTLSPASLYFWRQSSSLLRWGNIVMMGGFLFSFLAMGYTYCQKPDVCRLRHRNFYGTYSVIDVHPSKDAPVEFRKLVHGMTLHGIQILGKNQERVPTTYYFRSGPIGDVFGPAKPPRRIAVVGLGAGVMAALMNSGDRLTYYEIDPDNERIARRWFTFLANPKGPVNVVVGDARLSLQQKPKDGGLYDIITIDAFTGDGIPTHMLTREAMQVYLSRLAPDGLLLFHITNRYYDLRPLMKALGEEFRLHGAMNIPALKASLGKYDFPTKCVVFARQSKDLQALMQRGWVPLGEGDGLPKAVPWTDDYINILSPLIARFQVRQN